MECNKDEACRAKEIAEEKLLAKNISGAKKFALKAQNLYPGLEGMPQLVAAIDVHVAAEKKLNGETDWYGILGVNSKYDEESIRKQYRKLALMLHPDKNKSLGADGAFKLVSQSWSLLSDKEKRAAYDKKIQAKMFQKPSNPSDVFVGARRSNDSVKPKKVSKTPRSSNGTIPTTPLSSKPETFWTICHRCKMQYEYLRVYINHNLLCPHCREPFLAIETAPPAINGKKMTGDRSGHQNDRGILSFGNNLSFNDVGTSSNYQKGFANSDWSPFSGSGSPIVKAATVVRQAYAKAKRQRVEAQAASKREEALKRKNNSSKRMDDGIPGGVKNSSKRRKVFSPTNPPEFTSESVDELNKNDKIYSFSDGILLDYQNLFLQKAKKTIIQKLNDWKSVKKKALISKTNEEHQQNLETHPENSNVGENHHTLRTISMDVSCSEFHSFDIDRSEKCFEEKQVWAAYDISDGMPRSYAIIDSVISLNPFRIQISRLSSKASSFTSLHWLISGFSQSCGDFRARKPEMHDSVASFSHKVKWVEGKHGTIRIYPKKGDVWALYRNWSPSWNELTMNETIFQYDLVEVLEGYNEEHGVIVVPLLKVSGFKTIFKRHVNSREVKMICPDEIFRFSHQIPSRLLGGDEDSKPLKGCLELDPAAAPSELQVSINELDQTEKNCFS